MNGRKLRYLLYLASPEWLEKRQEAFAAYGARCGTDGPELHVHHRTYVRLYAEPVEDLEVLCESCHGKHHQVETKKLRKQRKRSNDEWLEARKARDLEHLGPYFEREKERLHRIQAKARM